MAVLASSPSFMKVLQDEFLVKILALAWSLEVLVDTVLCGRGSHPLCPKMNPCSPFVSSWDSDLVAPCC